MLNVGRDCFGIACGFLGLTVIIDIVGAGAFLAHMRPPRVVPAFEFRTEVGQVIKTSDQSNSVKPFFLESFDDTFGNRDGSVFSDRAVSHSLMSFLWRVLATEVRCWPVFEWEGGSEAWVAGMGPSDSHGFAVLEARRGPSAIKC